MGQARKGHPPVSVQTITTPCAALTCEDGNLAAVFTALAEDVDGSPAGVIVLCGPCAADMAMVGYTIKLRPFATSTDGRRLTWPE